MAKLPVLSGNDVVRMLSRIGYAHVRTTGSHAILHKHGARGKTVIPVPLHPELARGTLLSIIRQSGLTREEFLGLR